MQPSRSPALDSSVAGIGEFHRRRQRSSSSRRASCMSMAVGLCLGCLGARCLAAEAPALAAWEPAPGGKSRPLTFASSGKNGFTLVPSETTGITFSNHLAEATSAYNRVLENGSGVALGDVDGDGWCDIYFCRLEGPNVLYRNLGNWRFEDITAASDVACPNQYSTGAVFADLDGDGDLDLLVNSLGGGTRSFLNDGRGHFTEITDTRLVRRFGSTSMALADIDGDGDLDLYVTNYRTTTYKDRPPGLKVEATMVNGKIVVSPEDRFIPLMQRAGGVEVMEKGERDFLYLNDGKGRFAPVSWTSGSFLDEDGQPLKAPPTDWGLSVMFRDLNGDGYPDIYVCNDFFYFPDRVWLSEQGRRFRAAPRLALRNMSLSSMGMDFADIDRDGYDDFFVGDMLSRDHRWRQRQRPEMMKGLLSQPLGDAAARPEVPRSTLCLNRGDGTYAEIAQFSGLDATEWSWGGLFLDVDLDGYEDLLVPTGNAHDVQDADAQRARDRVHVESLESRLRNWRLFPPLLTTIQAFRNNHDLTFSEISGDWGFTNRGVFQGMALADLDNDGDLDLVVNCLDGPAALYRNNTAAPRIAVLLRGDAPNTRGIGAKIRVVGGPVNQSQEMLCGGRYLSGDDTLRVFAASAPGAAMRLEVTWRDGRSSTLEGALPNRLYEVDQASASRRPVSKPAGGEPQPWFQNVSSLLGHTHHDEPFDDFDRQPLLSRKLSQLGPGVAWADLDGDGWEDLVIGAGGGGQLAVYRNDGHGGFTALTNTAIAAPTSRDMTAILSWTGQQGHPVVLAGQANYEDAQITGASVRLYDLVARTNLTLLPAQLSSPGPLALADIDGDGDLDLFVGGRVVPGRYPEGAASSLYRNDAGKFTLDEANTALLATAGLVSGAVFTDLDGDGFADLVLACEWGPLRVFRNQGGRFTEATHDWGLGAFTGWWNGVTAGDFDGDGQLDLVASNWGRNTRFQRYLAQPLRVHYGESNNDGVWDLLETYFEPGFKKWTPWRDYDTVRGRFPALVEKCPTFRSYGEAGAEDVIGANLKSTRQLEAATLDSMVFLNRGGKFVAKPLPPQAQFSPAFGVTVGDFDGDGFEDVFVSQNFFDVEPETSRYDAGLGLCLRGDGTGGFKALGPRESGVAVFGQQRGCAVADYDGDGRLDVVVCQSRDATQLFRNLGARPGLRVRLRGPAANPTGVGAVVRAKFGDRLGPAHEVHAGSGYWAQDGPVLVIATPAPPSQLWVRWPGGRALTIDLPANARDIEVALEGTVKALR